MNKAKQVVETWGRQFHCAPREQRLAFLYLANDILQNSRRKGAEFVAEFWKVLPDSLRDVIEHGDGAAKSAALRLVRLSFSSFYAHIHMDNMGERIMFCGNRFLLMAENKIDCQS